MIKIENTDVYGWEAAIRGARNPMNSWDKTDTQYYDECGVFRVPLFGSNDRKLLQSLANAGPDHGKFLRMITVTMDITAPLYWWKEFDTYKVGTVANSCSTMHKIHAKPFSAEDFSHDHMNEKSMYILDIITDYLNAARDAFIATNDKAYWWQMIQLLPTSYNQRRTVLLNYQVLKSMYNARKNHKLDEWRDFCKFINTLPYSELIADA
jgi:hypothetical protein